MKFTTVSRAAKSIYQLHQRRHVLASTGSSHRFFSKPADRFFLLDHRFQLRVLSLPRVFHDKYLRGRDAWAISCGTRSIPQIVRVLFPLFASSGKDLFSVWCLPANNGADENISGIRYRERECPERCYSILLAISHDCVHDFKDPTSDI